MRAVAALAFAAVLSGCGGGGDEDALEQGTLNVYAASSLTEAFGELEGVFEAANPGIDVAISVAGSQVLRLQIEQGAGADVFAAANDDHMQALVDSGLVTESQVFAHNDLVVIVPLDNPAGLEVFADLTHAERIVLGTANVPVGQYAREILRRAGPNYEEGFEAIVMSRVVSEETNVRLARTKVEMGEADAAIVYRTDAAASDQVRVIDIPRELNVIADYPVGVLSGSTMPTAAEAWVALLMSPEGQAILGRHGFIIQ